MRDIKNSFNQIQSLKAKSETVLKTMEKSGVLTDQIRCNILSATTLDELDHLVSSTCNQRNFSFIITFFTD